MHPESDERLSSGLNAPTPEVAHVLFMDVVSYSLLAMDQQNEVIHKLQDIVRLLPEFEQAQKAGELICLPTGDGMALAFFSDLTAPVRCARQVALALQHNTQFQLRMGIHTGPVYRVADINTSRNVAGGGINLAQRVMDCGDGGHILISRTTADMLVQLSAWKGAIHDLGEVEVKHGVRVHICNVFTAEFGNPQIPSKVRRGTTGMSSGAEPNLGRMVSKMCDRRTQEEDFRDTFLDALERYRETPQIYFITGEEGQCHESLVQRLIDRANRCVATVVRDDSAGGRMKKIPWQYDGELAQRTSRLVYSLFENLGPAPSRQSYGPKKVSAAAFSDLLANSLSAYTAIQHEVHASRWDSTTADLLANYIRFWNDVPPSSDRPPVLVFISIIFPRADRTSWKKVLPLGAVTASMRKKRIWNTLAALQRTSSIPCRVLAELPPITREDVLEWFSLNHIHDCEEKRMRAVDRLFPGRAMSPKAMWEIEAFCAEELRNFAAERGYDDRRQWNKALFGRGDTNLEAQSAATAV
jgi:class 3 adenylate cyclase